MHKADHANLLEAGTLVRVERTTCSFDPICHWNPESVSVNHTASSILRTVSVASRSEDVLTCISAAYLMHTALA
jgi:hypothetical protein